MSALVWSTWTTASGRDALNVAGVAVVAFTIFFSPRRLARFLEVDVLKAGFDRAPMRRLATGQYAIHLYFPDQPRDTRPVRFR